VLATFLRKLTKPTALFCCNDKVALRISNLSETIGVHVPQDIALLGVDNDEIVCELANPGISSVELSAEQIGWEAAKLLDDNMNRIERPGTIVRTVHPAGIRQRGSTETHATHDSLIQGVLRHISGREGYRMSVQDVANAFAVSRRVLEKRFKRETNSTIHERILAQRIHRARDLLETGDEKVDTIAHACGFGSSQRFYVQFRRFTGMTPIEYRSRRRQVQRTHVHYNNRT
jgi:LacI family transcriptional regulator